MSASGRILIVDDDPASLSALGEALSREGYSVTLASGATPNLTLNPAQSIMTMTAYIVQVSLGDTPAGTLEFQTIFAVGMALFLMTLAMNIVAQWVLARFRQAYV